LVLTHNIEVAELRLGADGVDLAHVAAAVLLLDIPDVEEPSAVVVVRHGYPWIAGYHVGMHRQDGRLFVVHPRDLRKKKDTMNNLYITLCET